LKTKFKVIIRDSLNVELNSLNTLKLSVLLNELTFLFFFCTFIYQTKRTMEQSLPTLLTQNKKTQHSPVWVA